MLLPSTLYTLVELFHTWGKWVYFSVKEGVARTVPIGSDQVLSGSIGFHPVAYFFKSKLVVFFLKKKV